MIKIITIDREYGSGGAAIAETLATQRGWKLWDQELTCEIARLMKCDRSTIEKREEKSDSLYYRLLKSFMRGGFEGNSNLQPLELLDSDAMAHLTERVVRNAASEGKCVIVGRGSAYFLQDAPHVFHVFSYATREAKLRRLRQQGKSWSEAEHLIDTVDAERATFIKHYYRKCWPDRQLFDLMINTSGGEDVAVEVINAAIKAQEARDIDHAVLTEVSSPNCP